MFERKINDFNLKNTFENGQCFRFNAYEDGYLGVALNNVIFLRQDRDSFFIDGVKEDEFNEKFVQYFDLNRDYKKITESFKSEENMAAAVEYGRGMRILRQDSWETLISFIISQNNNIGRIKGIIERLCIKCGSRLEYNDTIFYAFPTPEQLKDMKVQDYSLLGCGYRAEYLYETVKNILDDKTELEKISKMGYDNAREALMQFKGVGPKVADCILLFGFGRFCAFPVDTWIKKVMERLYLKRSASKKEIADTAEKLFGEYAGLAQQYLFYYAREHKIKGVD